MTTKKSKSKNEAKKKPAPKKLEHAMLDAVLASFRAATTSTIDKRKELLARVAGAIAAGLVTAPSPSISTPTTMATVSVDIAEAILNKAGIPGEPSAEASAPGASAPGNDASVGAA